jgi:hypothetical protein
VSGETEAKFYAALLTAGLPEGTEAATREEMDKLLPLTREAVMKEHIDRWSKVTR